MAQIGEGDYGAQGGSGSALDANGRLAVTPAPAVGSATLEVPVVYGTTDTNSGLAIHGSDAVGLIGGGYEVGFDGANKILVGDSAFKISWSASGNGPWGGGGDTSLGRVAPKVLKVAETNGANFGWLQQEGKKRVTANVTNATATLANLADLTHNLQAGRAYSGFLTFLLNESTAADGFKLDFGGGSATFTSINFSFNGTPTGATIGTRSSAAAATAITLTALGDTGDLVVEIFFTCVVNAAGTLIPRQAQNAHSTGTLTIKAGSISSLEDLP